MGVAAGAVACGAGTGGRDPGVAGAGVAAAVCAQAASMPAKLVKAVTRIPKTKTVGTKRDGFERHLPKEVTALRNDGVSFISFSC
jgi:hypothetical protein